MDRVANDMGNLLLPAGALTTKSIDGGIHRRKGMPRTSTLSAYKEAAGS